MPGPTIKLDRRSFDQAIRAGLAGSLEARKATLRRIGTQSLMIMRADAEARARDTGRFLRGLDLAQNQLGVQRVPLTQVRPTRHHATALARLRAQAESSRREAERWARNVAGYESKGGAYASWPSYRKAVKIAADAKLYAERAAEALKIMEDDPSALVLGGGKAKKLFALRKLTRSFAAVYGAEAILTSLGSALLLIFKHKEPHARIVEKRTGIIARGLAPFRSVGITTRKSVQRDYLAALFPAQARRAA